MKQKLILVCAVLGTAVPVAMAAPKPAPAAAPKPAATVTPAAPAVTKAPVLSKQQSDFFEKEVRPVLAANCYRCHSAAEGKAKGGLTLDTREGLLKGGESGTALIPGNPEKSKLIVAIGYKDNDLQMPPKGEKLSDKEIAALTQWVRMGAPDPRTAANGAVKLTGMNDKAKQHWAFQPVKRVDVPRVKDASWVKSPIDAFVLNKLEANNMKPSPAAPREVLIRRASYDLIGLPPTPEEVSAFVSDQSPNAWEKVVDRLLASPHYGERWGRYWLDSARYSDTSGEERTRREDYRFAFAWTYRDYVIDSFNKDKPYDQFLMEQLAADQMPITQREPQRLAALGFLTVGKRFQNMNDQIDERIDAITKATMGLTVACARCHDHKFDPIPTADYYSLHGILVSTVEPPEKPLIGKPTPGPQYDDYLKQLAELEQKNRDIYYKTVAEKSEEFRRKATEYITVSLLGRKSGNREEILERTKLIAEYKLDQDLFRTIKPNGQHFYLFGPILRFAGLSPAELPQKAKGILDEIATGKIQGKPIDPLVVAGFKACEPSQFKTLKDVAAVYGKVFKDADAKAREYLQANRALKNKDQKVTGFDPSIIAIANFPTPIEPAWVLETEKLKGLLYELPIKNNNAYQLFLFPQINELNLTHPGAPPRAMIVADSPNPRNSPIFIRGEAQNRGPVVPRQFLEIIAGPKREPFKVGSGRMELAQAIATKRNPLTARVAVNRIWMHHFGEGFVRTLDDMGVQSEAPSHPELIDFLATKFTDNGWSMKQMHRMIMLSNTYQQSSETRAEYANKDPDNRLLWRANLRRLDFEAARDSMLQFTGKIDLSIGGKPVNLTEEPYSNRRSVYGYIDRGEVPELMQQFDFADPDMANSRRTSTIVPQQALFFMNSPMSVDVVRKVTSRPEFKGAANDVDRVKAIYAVLMQRAPRPEEIKVALEFVQDEEDDGPSALPSNLSPSQATKQAMAKAANKAKAKGNGRKAIMNQGEVVERRPLTTWELYAQSLLFTNEIAYVN